MVDLRDELNANGTHVQPDTPQVQLRLLARLGQALCTGGDPVSSTRDALLRVTRTFGIQDIEIGVLPTLVFIRAGQDAPAVEVASVAASGPDKTLRLDQISVLYAIVRQVESGRLSAVDAMARVDEMWRLPPRFGLAARVLGHAILVVGLGLILTPRLNALIWCVGLGLLVGLAKELGEQWETTDVLLPVVASLLVSLIVFRATMAGQIVSPLLLLIPPLITFLPGGMLTTAMIELADGNPISGATRLIAGATQVLLLVFGIVAGESLVGIAADQAYAIRTDNLIGWWAPVVGPLVFAIGIELNSVGPPRSLPWLIFVVYVAWAGESVGSATLGGYVGGFFGALVMTVVAYTVDRFPSAPPSRVLFLPAFWLLVPGSLAVVSVAELVGSDLEVSVAKLTATAFTIVAIALGVLVGVAVSRRARR
ncbi:MAG: threonine/serine exporter family protein [Chloroflexi bacterium]|nr:threonine/serine exporter family protein [Chloroflexota bacterium]MBV9597424.1 threonine/serine exporter family protein [Chloroflexota bacterium]